MTIDELTARFPEAIPTFGLVLYFIKSVLSMVLEFYRRREIIRLHHAERLASIAKGIKIPSLPQEFFLTHHREIRWPRRTDS